MKDLHLRGIALLLTLIGLTLFIYKVWFMGFPMIPNQKADSWTIETRLELSSKGGPVKAELMLPYNPPGFATLDENFASHGFGLTTSRIGSNRQAIWTLRRGDNRMVLYYRLELYGTDSNEIDDTDAPETPDIPEFKEPLKQSALTLLEEARAKSADSASFTSLILSMLNDPSPSENVRILLGNNPDSKRKSELAIKLLAGARIPARTVHGILLTDRALNAQPIPWLEIHNGKSWLPYNPQTGTKQRPDNFLIWWRGEEPLVKIEGAKLEDIRFSVASNPQKAVEVANQRATNQNSELVNFSLLSLPLQTQNVYKVLLLVPVGVFLIVILRNIVGIQTFGTFMPVLIALAFRETELIWGIVLFSTIIFLGLGIRFYLEHLKLLLVPRLAAVVIVVVLLMAFLSILAHKIGLERGLSVALFPMVILAMTIERMSIVWEEHGPVSALKQGFGSLTVAAISYLVMSLNYVEHIVFFFPELLLVLLAVTLILGRYSGYRLLELQRFRSFKKM